MRAYLVTGSLLIDNLTNNGVLYIDNDTIKNDANFTKTDSTFNMKLSDVSTEDTIWIHTQADGSRNLYLKHSLHQ